MINKLSKSLGEKVLRWTYDATYSKEPDHYLDGLGERFHIRPRMVIGVDVLEKIYSNVEVENRRDADRPEKAHKHSLAPLFDLGDEFMDGKNPGEAPKEKHQNSERHEAIDRYDLVVGEACPWTDHSIPWDYQPPQLVVPTQHPVTHHMKMETFSNMSIVGCSESSRVSSRNLSAVEISFE